MVSPQRWFEIHFVVSVVLFVLLGISVPIYGGNENLPTNAAVLAAFVIGASLITALGIALAHYKRDKRGTFVVFFAITVLHLVVTGIMIAEWADGDCTEHVFSLCIGNNTDFFVVILIDLVVQLFFLYEYKMVWAWKNQLIDEGKRKPAFEAEDDETFGDTIVVPVRSSENEEIRKF